MEQEDVKGKMDGTAAPSLVSLLHFQTISGDTHMETWNTFLFGNRTAKAVVVTFVVLACTVGCDSKKASTGNFKAALQRHFDKYPACEHGMSFPEQITLGSDGKPPAYTFNAARDQALKDAGLLTVKETTAMRPANLFMPRTEEHLLTYDIASDRKKQWTADENAPKLMKLCYARIKIDSVENYSEPGDMLGQTISEVEFSYELTHFEEWAKNKEVQEAMPELNSKMNAGEQKSKTVLIQTHNGWEPDASTRL